MSNRIERLKEYARPTRAANWDGPGRDAQNISRWSARATENSALAPRAKGGDVSLPDTGKQTELRYTAMSPRTSRNVDKRMAAKADTNFVGSSAYMAGIRRDT
jgi:hypothetical protein